jgi:CrcB protein
MILVATVSTGIAHLLNVPGVGVRLLASATGVDHPSARNSCRNATNQRRRIGKVASGDGARRMRRKADGSYQSSARRARGMTREERMAAAGGDVPGEPQGPKVASRASGGFDAMSRHGPFRRVQLFMIIAVGCGGVVGALARYSVSLALPNEPGRFPFGTFVVNVSGSAVLGFLLVLLIEQFPRSRFARPVIGTGIIGAYTTFSTYVVDAVLLFRAGKVGVALLYIVASVVCGLLAVWMGMLGARVVLRLQRRMQEEIS